MPGRWRSMMLVHSLHLSCKHCCSQRPCRWIHYRLPNFASDLPCFIRKQWRTHSPSHQHWFSNQSSVQIPSTNSSFWSGFSATRSATVSALSSSPTSSNLLIIWNESLRLIIGLLLSFMKFMVITAVEIHSHGAFWFFPGGVRQKQRLHVLEAFKKETDHGQILVCSDVLARGIDIDGVDLVVNYDCPKWVPK